MICQIDGDVAGRWGSLASIGLADVLSSPGSVIFPMRGIISTRANKYSVQLGQDKHIDFPPVRKPNDDLDYAWQYVNHNCEPNGYVNAAEYTFCALRNIRKGEEITFNYLTDRI